MSSITSNEPPEPAAIHFRSKIWEKYSPWLYIHTGVYLTMTNFWEKILYFKAIKYAWYSTASV